MEIAFKKAQDKNKENNTKFSLSDNSNDGTIDGIAYTVIMDIRRSPNGQNRFYIHDLKINKAGANPYAPISKEKRT